MVNVQASDLDMLLNLSSDVPDATLEVILDQAIDLLNLYGADLANMTGTAGSKTVGLESKERGAVFHVARVVYHSFYKGIDQAVVNGLAVSSPDLMSNPSVVQTVREAAHKLSELEVDVG